MQTLEPLPPPDLLNQNLHANKIPRRPGHVHRGLQSDG